MRSVDKGGGKILREVSITFTLTMSAASLAEWYLNNVKTICLTQHILQGKNGTSILGEINDPLCGRLG